MFTYTKRELRLLALSLTLFVLLIYNQVLFPLINSIFNLDTTKIHSNYVYSKTIPIQEVYQMSDTTIYKSIIQKEKSATETSDTTNSQSKQDTQKQEESKYFDAEMKFNILIADINKIIGEAVQSLLK